jgi:hypothetical protein
MSGCEYIYLHPAYEVRHVYSTSDMPLKGTGVTQPKIAHITQCDTMRLQLMYMYIYIYVYI